MTTNLELGEAIADKLGGYVAKIGVHLAPQLAGLI